VDDDLDPELIRFLREELGHDVPTGREWTFTGPLWIWKGKAADGKPSPMSWHFLTITGDAAAGIRAAAPGRSAAWARRASSRRSKSIPLLVICVTHSAIR
jgi:hypothetical protein